MPLSVTCFNHCHKKNGKPSKKEKEARLTVKPTPRARPILPTMRRPLDKGEDSDSQVDDRAGKEDEYTLGKGFNMVHCNEKPGVLCAITTR